MINNARQLSRSLVDIYHQSPLPPPLNPALEMTLPAFAAERGRQQQTDSWYAAYAGRSAANQPIDGTDGRTDTRPLHRPCSAYYAGSVSNNYSVIIGNVFSIPLNNLLYIKAAFFEVSTMERVFNIVENLK